MLTFFDDVPYIFNTSHSDFLCTLLKAALEFRFSLMPTFLYISQSYIKAKLWFTHDLPVLEQALFSLRYLAIVFLMCHSTMGQNTLPAKFNNVMRWLFPVMVRSPFFGCLMMTMIVFCHFYFLWLMKGHFYLYLAMLLLGLGRLLNLLIDKHLAVLKYAPLIFQLIFCIFNDSICFHQQGRLCFLSC